MSARHANAKSKLDQLDTPQAILITIYQIFAGVFTGVFLFGIEVIDFDFSEALYEVSSVVIQTDALIAAAAGLAIVMTNEIGGSEYTTTEKALVASVPGIPALYMLFEPFRDLMHWDPWVGVIVFLIMATLSVVLAAVEDVGRVTK